MGNVDFCLGQKLKLDDLYLISDALSTVRDNDRSLNETLDIGQIGRVFFAYLEVVAAHQPRGQAIPRRRPG